ncbi:MAG: hypothetical protein QNJ35_06170 [Paracoccaceae bacterium]|nr:hypothetical protein [Paracoccaceae bacterium]
MRTGALVLVFGLSSLLSATTASADISEAECANDGSQVQPAVTHSDLVELIGWIALHTDYDLRSAYSDPPAIEFCEIGDLIEYEAEELLVDEILSAAYDPSRRRVYLVRPWTKEKPEDLSVLLHELIHAVQLDNRDWPCPGAPEWEAYSLQALWLQEHGIMPNFDWRAIFRLSQCPAGAAD